MKHAQSQVQFYRQEREHCIGEREAAEYRSIQRV